MRAGDRSLTVCDRLNVLRDTVVGAWVKRRWHCDEHGMSVSCCVGSEVGCPCVHCYEKVEYEKDLSRLMRRFDGQPLSEFALLLVVMRHPFSHLCFPKEFDYFCS